MVKTWRLREASWHEPSLYFHFYKAPLLSVHKLFQQNKTKYPNVCVTLFNAEKENQIATIQTCIIRLRRAAFQLVWQHRIISLVGAEAPGAGLALGGQFLWQPPSMFWWEAEIYCHAAAAETPFDGFKSLERSDNYSLNGKMPSKGNEQLRTLAEGQTGGRVGGFKAVRQEVKEPKKKTLVCQRKKKKTAKQKATAAATAKQIWLM